MPHLQLFGSMGIGLVIILMFYTLTQSMRYLAEIHNHNYEAARCTNKRMYWSAAVIIVLMILLLLPIFIWPR